MSSITTLLASKLTVKKKAKTIADALLQGTLQATDLEAAMPHLPVADLAIVMESLEVASRKEPAVVNDELFDLLVEHLSHTASRVRWEAARTIGNVARHYDSAHLEPAVNALLANTTDDSTVVRWASARALIVILHAGYTADNFRERLAEIAQREQDEGVRAVYDNALRTQR